MMLENKEAVIFDLDGTITDSMWVWADIDRIRQFRLLRGEGFSPLPVSAVPG